MYSAITIAHYIINECSTEGKPISNLKLQMILYYSLVGYYKKTKQRLYQDKIYAWQFGPVVPSIYEVYCVYGGFDIDMSYFDFDNIDFEDKEILTKIVQEYREIPTSRLLSMTHRIGGPWYKVFAQDNNKRHEIPFNLIQQLECA